jgi:hypothetical protein
MLNTSGEKQESMWGFDIEVVDEGCVLVHHFQMGKATDGIHRITMDMEEVDKRRFIADWTTKLERDLDTTLKRIKDVVEKKGSKPPVEAI